MTWKNENLHLMKGNFFASHGDSALFFRQLAVSLMRKK